MSTRFDARAERETSTCDGCGLDVREWLSLLSERDRLRDERDNALAKVHGLEAELGALRASRDQARDVTPRRRDTRPFDAPLLARVEPGAHRAPDARAESPRSGSPFVEAPRRASFDPPAAQQRVQAEAQGIDFGAVSRLTPTELDGLPYGLVTLDAAGRILHYNDTESRLAGLPASRVLGRFFFDEVAPCTRVREFKGRFEELVRDPATVRVQTFDFVFPLRDGPPGGVDSDDALAHARTVPRRDDPPQPGDLTPTLASASGSCWTTRSTRSTFRSCATNATSWLPTAEGPLVVGTADGVAVGASGGALYGAAVAGGGACAALSTAQA